MNSSRPRFTHTGLGLVTAGALLLVSACVPHRDPVRVQWLTMGTVAAVQCVAPDAAPQARDISQHVFDEINTELSAWSDESALGQVNHAAGTPDAIPISRHFEKVLKYALTVTEESDGAFNPLIGPVMKAWGFNGSASRPTPPLAEELRAATALTNWRDIQFVALTNGSALRLRKAGMQLDLGAIAKGYAVDAAWERLKAAGHTNLLVDLGGNLRALGEAATGRQGWRTGVRNPFAEGALIGLFLMRDGEAVATSGNYERFVEIEGIRYAHIMNPHTGMPVTGMAGTTVVAPTAMEADALSTTLFILGPQKGIGVLRNHPGCEALWIPDTPGHLTVIATPGMAARLKPIGQTAYDLKTVERPSS